MMKVGMLTIAFLTALAGAAIAQDGGKLTWMGKGQDPVRPAYNDALDAGRPIMFFFTVQGNKDCIELCEGAFSNREVVDAAAQISCIFVECGNKKNFEIVSLMEITKFPTLIFVDPHGVALGTVSQRDASELASAIRDMTNRFLSRPHYPENVDKALETARRSGRPLLLYFYDDSPACLTINKSLSDPELKPLNNRLEVAMTLMERGSAMCTKYDVERAPTLLVLNARLPKPEAKPLARITASRTPRELHRDLEEALEALKSSAAVEPSPAPSSVPRPAVKETLSDDEIDRKFIQARMNVALDLQKRGMTAKAVDVLEDVLQTYPKHVLTKDVKELLEKLKK